MRYQRPFRDVIPHSKVGHPRVTHPFATLLIPCGTFAFDLHVLGTPPALILSQDQTLKLNSLSPLPALRPRAERNSFNPISLLKMALGFIPTKAPTQPKLRGAKMGPFKYGWVCAPEGAAHPLILDGLCLHVLSSFQRTEPCIALPCFRSATFQIYDSSYIAVNPKNRPVARFFTPLSSPKPVKRRRIRHRGSSRLQDRSGSGRPGTCCAGPEATSTCHVDRRDSLRTSKN